MSVRKNAQRRKAALALAVCGASVAVANVAFGVDYSWSPAGGSNNWSVAENWISSDPVNFPPPPPSEPAPGEVTNLIFGGSYDTNQTSTQNIGSITVNSFVINAQFTAATLSLSTATSLGDQFVYLGAGGIVGNVPEVPGSGTVVFQGGNAVRRIILTADQTWSNTNTVGIISQRRHIDGAFKVTKTGAGTIELQGDNSNWTGGLQIDDGYIRTSASSNALGAGTITVNTDNDAGFSASGSSQVDQMIAGPVILGGAGEFRLRGSWNFQFDNTITLLSDKTVQVNNIGTFNGAFGGPHRVTISGGGESYLNAANTHGGFDISSGIMYVASDDRLGAAGAALGIGGEMDDVVLTQGTVRATGALNSSARNINTLGVEGGILDTNGFNASFGNVSGPAGFTKAGAGELTVNHFRTASLSIGAGRVNIAPDGTAAGASTVGALELAGGTTPTVTLDVANNAFAVDYTGASPLATILDQIRAGANTGTGIVTSQGANYAVGYAEASSLTTVPAIFGTIDADAVLLRGTRGGDANLDGLVNLNDFNALAANFGQSGRSWVHGDFNYDNIVNLTDFNRLAANFGLSAAGPDVTAQDWSNLAAAVPEPSGMAAALVAGAGLLGRRRPRRQ